MADVPAAMPSEESMIAMAKDSSIGPFWGAFGACLAQGYIFHLAVRYYKLPASRWERLTVSVGLLGTILGNALVNHDMYQQTVVFYAGFQNMPFYSWMAGANCLVGGVVTLCTEAVFAFRLIKLHHGNKLIAIPLVIMVIGTFASHFPLARIKFPGANFLRVLVFLLFAQAANWASMDEMAMRIAPFLYAEYSMTAITDIILCTGTLWTLAKMQRTALPQTITKLKLLSYYAIESMALPTTCAIVAIILKIVRPQTSEHLIFLYWQKFVSMTVLLLVLLSREELSKDSSIDMASSSNSHPSSAKPTALTNFTESKTTMDSDSSLELGISKA